VFKILPLFAFSISEGHLAGQFLWLGIGIIIIIIFSLIIFQLLWKLFKLEAIKSTRMSLVTGLLLAFIWFTILFSSIISLNLIVIIGIIVLSILFLTISRLNES